MADGFSVTMTGVDELVKKLEGLKYDARKKGGRYALRKAAQVIRNKAKENAMRLDDPATPNKIYANILERWSNKYNRATGDLKFRVGVGGGARQYANTKHNVRKSRVGKEYFVEDPSTFYWRFLEFGTEKMAARPFMRPAMQQSGQAAADTFIREFGRAIDRALKKAGG